MECRLPQGERCRFAILFAVVLSCLLASKGLALLPGYMLDDYLHSGTYPGRELAYLSQGRFTEAVVQLLSRVLGLRWTEVYLFNLAMALLAYTWLISTSVSRLATRPEALRAQLLGGALIAVHPYFTELLAFRNAEVNTLCFVGLLCVFLHVWLRIDPRAGLSTNGWRQATAMLALALSIGAYQAALPMAGCMVMLISFQRALAGDTSGFAARWLAQWRTLLPLLGGTLLYGVTNWLIRQLLPSGMGDARGSLVGPVQILERLPKIYDLFAELLYRGSAFQSGPVTVLILLMLGGCLMRIWHAGWQAFSLAMVLFISLLVLCVLPLAVAGEWWPVYRALPAVAFLVGGLLTMGLGVKDRLPVVLVVGTVIAIWGLAGQSNRILFDQWRLNRWDMNRAAQLVQDIERIYGVDYSQAVSLIPPARPVHSTPLLSAMKDHGVSALQLTKFQSGLLREATGRSVRIVAPDRAAMTYCEMAASWPSSTAITVRDGVIYVCL